VVEIIAPDHVQQKRIIKASSVTRQKIELASNAMQSLLCRQSTRVLTIAGIA
jgi:hypothetical protein